MPRATISMHKLLALLGAKVAASQYVKATTSVDQVPCFEKVLHLEWGEDNELHEVPNELLPISKVPSLF